MCLITKDKEKTSKERIEVYKVLLKIGERYVTPYQHFCIDKIPIKLKDSHPIEVNYFNETFYVDGGFFHSFTSKKCAITAFGNRNAVIVKGYIPENTLYFVGVDEICSETLVLEKIVYPKENLLCTILKKLKNVLTT